MEKGKNLVKPRVCISDYTIKFYPEKYKRLLTSKNKSEKLHAEKKVKIVRLSKRSIPLDDKDNIPNKDMFRSVINRSLLLFGEKFKKDYIYEIQELKIHSESKATYYVESEKV